jgi:DNA sulfur modification protein DndB
MLQNLESLNNLRKIAKNKGDRYLTQTFTPNQIEEAAAHGWVVEKKNAKSVRMKKQKAYEVTILERIWSFLYKMNFSHMDAGEGAVLQADGKIPIDQDIPINILAVDDEVVVAILCRASSGKREVETHFRQEVDQLTQVQRHLAAITNQQIATNRPTKRRAACVIFACNIILSEEDKKYVKDKKFLLFDENDLEYYEDLVKHLGAAAKYQLLADILPGKEIPGLKIKLPAIRTKMGGFTCYSFAIEPESLLKVSYVAHHTRGKRTDLHAYQRMLEKERLDKIREYITKSGIFPTNIVINLDQNPTFQRGEQAIEQQGRIFGWLELKNHYKSAWIIDGQHRLYAYSGHSKASTAQLSVLAFETLPDDVQAQLFIDINNQQKSVKRSLLQQLYGEFNQDAQDPKIRVRALISQSIQLLDEDKSSPFYQRILSANTKKSKLRCLTWNSLYHVLDSTFFLSKKKSELQYGPFWVKDNDAATKERATFQLNQWFSTLKKATPDWWNAGSSDGGGLAMNDGVVACINVLKSVLLHLSDQGENLPTLNNQVLWKHIEPYAIEMSKYLASLSKEEREVFRKQRGIQGQTTRTKMCQAAIHKAIPTFMTSELKEFLEEQTNPQAKEAIANIERLLRLTILDILQEDLGTDEQQWWMDGIPQIIRQEAVRRYEEDKGKIGSKEHYFSLLDYKNIILYNWSSFQRIFGDNSTHENKEKQTAWISVVDDIQNNIADNASEYTISHEQLAQLKTYEDWLLERLG